MRIHTECMRFTNRWTICSTSDFQANQQRSQRRSVFSRLLYCDLRFSQNCCRCFQVLPGLLSALPGALRLVVGASSHVAGAPRCSHVHSKFSPAIRGVPKPITITPMVLLYHSSEIPVTLKAGRNALLESDTLLQLTLLSLHSTSSQILLEASSE